MLGLWSYVYDYDDRYVADLTSFLCFFLMLMLRRVASSIIGGGLIHIFVFCIIDFLWNRLFLLSVNTTIWIWAPPIIELATRLLMLMFTCKPGFNPSINLDYHLVAFQLVQKSQYTTVLTHSHMPLLHKNDMVQKEQEYNSTKPGAGSQFLGGHCCTHSRDVDQKLSWGL